MNSRLLDISPLGITWVIDEPMARTSHAIIAEGKVWIIDPVDEAEAMEKVAELGEPAAVVQLLGRHNRDSEKVADRLGVPRLVLPERIDDSPFESIPVISNAAWKERALWWPEERVLVVAEAIGTSRFYRPGEAGAGVHLLLRMTPPRRQLGNYLPLHLLVGHGAPIHGSRATDALQEAIDRSRRDLPAAIAGVPGAFRAG